MLGLVLALGLGSVAVAGVLPRGGAGSGDFSSDSAYHAFNSSDFEALSARGLFGPIATSNPAGIAGGQVACDSPPLSSFFAGLRPPVMLH